MAERGERSGTKTADFGPANKNYAPLICRVARAVRVLGAGLGFPLLYGFAPLNADNFDGGAYYIQLAFLNVAL